LISGEAGTTGSGDDAPGMGFYSAAGRTVVDWFIASSLKFLLFLVEFVQ
jgi:hypothetical protein